jgi:hypothetical protein
MLAGGNRGRQFMKRIILIAGIAALAACDKGPDVNVKNASVGEVAEKVREAAGSGSLVEPGKWQSKVTVLEVDMPGMPPQFAQRMKETIGKVQATTTETCLTEADVKKPKEDFFAGRSKNCRYEHFTMSGGTIDAAMTCTAQQGGTMTMTVNGTYASDSYDATMAMDMAGGRQRGMHMKSRIESHRLGECTGDEINAKNKEVGQ